MICFFKEKLIFIYSLPLCLSYWNIVIENYFPSLHEDCLKYKSEILILYIHHPKRSLHSWSQEKTIPYNLFHRRSEVEPLFREEREIGMNVPTWTDLITTAPSALISSQLSYRSNRLDGSKCEIMKVPM